MKYVESIFYILICSFSACQETNLVAAKCVKLHFCQKRKNIRPLPCVSFSQKVTRIAQDFSGALYGTKRGEVENQFPF